MPFGFIAPKHIYIIWISNVSTLSIPDFRNKFDIYVCIPLTQLCRCNLDPSREMAISLTRHLLFSCNFVVANRVCRFLLPICYTDHFKRININKTWPDKYWYLFIFLYGFKIFHLSCVTSDIILNLLKVVNIFGRSRSILKQPSKLLAIYSRKYTQTCFPFDPSIMVS